MYEWMNVLEFLWDLNRKVFDQQAAVLPLDQTSLVCIVVLKLQYLNFNILNLSIKIVHFPVVAWAER